MPPDPTDLMNQLSDPFRAEEVHWKPAVVQGDRALALAYIDARTIQDRLDAVLGCGNWQDDYEVLAEGSVLCRLRLRLGAEWVTKVDVGSPSEQPDGGDRMKAAFSDALKRAAVKFGIGRYLYRLPSQWVSYDPKKRAFARTPTLPREALPKQSAAAPATNGKAPSNGTPVNGTGELSPEALKTLFLNACAELQEATTLAQVKAIGQELSQPTSWAKRLVEQRRDELRRTYQAALARFQPQGGTPRG
jgi:hypothetical protein